MSTEDAYSVRDWDSVFDSEQVPNAKHKEGSHGFHGLHGLNLCDP